MQILPSTRRLGLIVLSDRAVGGLYYIPQSAGRPPQRPLSPVQRFSSPVVRTNPDVVRPTSTMPTPMPPRDKIIRDPVHDVIAFDLEAADDRLIFDLLSCREVQRLRRIRQLGLASLAYPGADHSRYSHSLGVFATARKMLDRLGRTVDISPRQRCVCLAAALLHDLGHGPFSHVFERVSGIHHEGITRRLILDGESEVHQTLIRHDAAMPEAVAAVLQCDSNPLLCDVLSSQLDADRLDYLLRDNMMTGSRYGRYDLAWLLQAMTVTEDGRLGISWKGVSAAEAYVQARAHMYRHVYFHKVVRSAEGMVKLALQRARELILAGQRGDVTGGNLNLPPGSGTVAKVLTDDRMSATEFRELDDISVLGCFKQWRDAGDPQLARLCTGLLDRGLYKTIDGVNAGQYQKARDAVIFAGGDGNYDLFHDSLEHAPYTPGTGGIRIVHGDGSVVDFSDMSPITEGLRKPLVIERLHVAPEFYEVALKATNTSF